MVAMMLTAPCASEWDRDAMLVLRYFLSPFIDLGSIAVVLTHIGLTILITVLHFFIVYAVRRANHHTGLMDEWSIAYAYCFFPAVPMVVGTYLYLGVAIATIEGFVSADAASIAVGAVLGLPHLAAMPAATWWVSRHSIATFQDADPSTKFNAVVQKLMPIGHWSPAVENRWILGAHGWVRAEWLRMAPLITPYGVGFLMAIVIVAINNCRARYALVCVISAVCCVALAAVRPHRAVTSSILSSIAFGALCVLSGAQVKALSEGERSEGVNSLRLAAMVVLLISVLLRTAHGALVLWLYRDPIFDLNLIHDEPSPHNGELDDLDVKKDAQVESRYSPRNSAAVSRAASYQPKPRDGWVAQDQFYGEEDEISKAIRHINVDFDDGQDEKERQECMDDEAAGDVVGAEEEEIPTQAMPEVPIQTLLVNTTASEERKSRLATVLKKTQVDLDDFEDLE